MFICFAHDLGTKIRNSNYLAFADDFQLYHSCLPEDLPRTIALVNEDIRGILNWNKKNNFVLNENKTQAILLGSQNSVKLEMS